MPAQLLDLIPVQVLVALGGLGDRVANGIVMTLGGRAHNFDDFVDMVGHENLLAKIG
jgi:hypothetical protein